MLKSLKLWWYCRGLSSANPAKYGAAVNGLARLRHPGAVEPLLPGLDRKEAVLRQGVAGALGEIGDVRAIKPLVLSMENDQEASVRTAAAKSLGRIADKQALKPLVKALGDHDADVRVAAAKSLALLGETQWKDWVKGTDSDFERLAESNERRAVEALALAVHNVKWNVRSAALEGLGRLGDRDAIGPLTTLVNDEHQRVRVTAIGWLLKLRDRRGIEPLILSLRHKDPETRVAAVQALAEWGERRTVLELRKHLEDEDDRVCHAIVDALTKMGDIACEAPPGRGSGAVGIQARSSGAVPVVSRPPPTPVPSVSRQSSPGIPMRQPSGAASVPTPTPKPVPSPAPGVVTAPAKAPAAATANAAPRPVTGITRIPPKSPPPPK